MISSSFTFIDLFCGVGGFHQAMASLGGNCVFASDIDPHCREAYKANYGLEPAGDITQISAEDVPAHDVLCGGFPCQAFSKAGHREGLNDPRGNLFFDILRIAKHHMPSFLVLENVRNLFGHDQGRTWLRIRQELRDAGYQVMDRPIILSPNTLGIPQLRERVFILCIREDLGSLPEFYVPDTGEVACSIDMVLDDIPDGVERSKYALKPDEIGLINNWNEFLQKVDNEEWGFPIWSVEFNDNPVPEGLPKWKSNFIRKNRALYARNRQFIDSWLPVAEENPLFTGAKAKLEWQAGSIEKDLWRCIMQFRPSGIRVKRPDYFPALVAITQTSIIGKLKRRLTPRECARLQSFPDSFKLPERDAVAYKQFGNSVNVAVVYWLASQLLGKEDETSLRERVQLLQNA